MCQQKFFSTSIMLKQLVRNTIKLSINPAKYTQFADYNVKTSFKQPTRVQRNMLAALNSDLSVLVRSSPGTGKSTAACLYMMKEKALKGQGVVSLVLVPTPTLCLHYYNLLNATMGDKVHVLYRTGKSEEQTQLNTLREKKPSILISTPTRLLDILSSDKHHVANFSNLKNIVIDEVDYQLPKHKYSKPTSMIDDVSDKKSPVDILLSHITNTNPNSQRQFMLLSSTASSYLKSVPWLKGQRPLIPIGVDSNGGTNRNRLPREVDLHFVLYSEKSKALKDVKPFKLDSLNKLPNPSLKTKITQEPLQQFKPNPKDMHAYIQAFERVHNMEGGKKGLLIVPDEFSNVKVCSMLDNAGIDAAHLALESPVQHKTKYDLSRFFKPMENPQVLVASLNSIRGLDFEGLDRVYVMSWGSLHNSVRDIIHAAGRCRGLPVQERGEAGKEGLTDYRSKMIVFELNKPDTLGVIQREVSHSLAKLGASSTKYCRDNFDDDDDDDLF